jgi:hypothetical protein
LVAVDPDPLLTRGKFSFSERDTMEQIGHITHKVNTPELQFLQGDGCYAEMVSIIYHMWITIFFMSEYI